jgi:putative membrane protein
VALLLSCVAPLYPAEMSLQHSPTIALLLATPFVLKKWPVPTSAVACLGLFVLLHIIGARWIYSYVPYDIWVETVAGRDMSKSFGWSRNHYDRLVHFMYGLLWVLPLMHILRRHLKLSPRLALYVALEWVLATSMLYELFEYGLTLAMASEKANAYNGQQGDLWDAQKDMALATLGALIATGLILLNRALKKQQQPV